MNQYNETHNYVEAKRYGEIMIEKWADALEENGGIKDQHKALTTAILMENYSQYLQKEPTLIMEDQVESSAFKGVNLALLGLYRRVIPEFVGGDLVGVQAMPTPRSPIFYLWWKKSTKGNATVSTTTKGATTDGDELFGYPQDQVSDIQITDPYFGSSKVVKEDAGAVANYAPSNTAQTVTLAWRPVVNSSVYVSAFSTDDVELARVYFSGSYTSPATIVGTVVAIPGAVANFFDVTPVTGTQYVTNTFVVTIKTGAYTLPGGVTLGSVKVGYEYTQEANKDKPELVLEMKEELVKLCRRELRGKFTLDAMTDARAYWGINLENEMMEIMKMELMNEMNREIVEDLRLLASNVATIDYTAATTNNVIGNYDDTAKLVLDTIENLAAEIWNQSRLGKGNFVVGNPATLAFLNRVPGFVGSGVNYDGKTLVFAGSLQNRMNFYLDPQYRKNELLVGYKGPSAIDTGYIYAPYLPVTPTPTMYDPETGDPRKIFYTRYGKTFNVFDSDNGGLSSNKIYRGDRCYARLKLVNFPQLV